jgi:predicted neuraminidase
MNIIELEDSKLLAFFRSRDADRIYTSISTDMGRTWTAPERSSLPNNNSSTQAIKLTSGNLVMVYNDVTLERDQIRPAIKNGKLVKKALRTPLTVALSEDHGETWPYIRNIQMSDDEYLESQIGYSYPSIIQSNDENIHIAYTYLRKGIKHIMLKEEWIKATPR